MKKSIRINISGLIFNIDEDAYKSLESYLQRLREHFGESESTEEIIADIESRIAEILQEKSQNSENVINLEMVQSAIKAMGEPREIDGEEEGYSANEQREKQKKEKTYKATYKKVKRKLYRDPENKVVGGVASGLAAYFGIDPVWVRLAFVVLTISGMSLLVYIVLWIVIPEAKTTAQRLEMRGEAINLENIEKSIRDEFDDISNRFKDIKDKHFSKKKDELTIFEKIANAIISIISGILKFIGAFFGIILAFIALIIILAFVPSFFGNSFVWLNGFNGINFISLNSILGLLTNSVADVRMLQTSLSLVIFIPLISLVYLGVKIIFGIRTKNSVIGLSLLVLWILGLVFLVFSSVKIGRSYDRKAEITHNASLGRIVQDTLFVNFINTDSNTNILPLINPVSGSFVLCNNDDNFYMSPDIRTIILDSNEEVSLEVRTIARGRNYIHAQHNVESINYKYSYNENVINLQDYCYWNSRIGYRAQRIIIVIGIPEGKAVVFKPQQSSNSNFEINDCFYNTNGHRFIYVDDYNNRFIISDGVNIIDFDK